MAENPLISLMNREEINIEQKIVEELLNNKNLETKTELNKPILWSCMAILEEFLQGKKLKKSALVLKSFSQFTFRFLISKDRKGRLEYLEALKGLKDRLIQNNPLSMNTNPLNK